MATKVAILGGGAMATAISAVLAEKPDVDISLWTRSPEVAREMTDLRENKRLLPGIRIPSRVEISADFERVVAGSELLVVAIPSAFLRSTLNEYKNVLTEDRPVVSVVKGLENGTFLRPSEIVSDVLGQRAVVSLSGPSHAEEVARRLPASVVAGCGDLTLAKRVQSLFSTDRFRVYTNLDLIGVELGGALKNVIAIAAGICDGFQYGDNAKSALITRGQVEMTRFGLAFGAESKTFYGLSGMGDLMTTCFSKFSRNRMVGHLLGEGKSLEAILNNMKGVAEGVTSARAVSEVADKQGIEMPITREVYNVLFHGKTPEAATDSLMSRPIQSED